MFEKDLPGQNSAGFNEASVDRALPLESCDTINGAWGYNATDKRFKSTKQLIHYLVRAAGHNANFLLNIGPMPTGVIQPEFVTRLKEIGAWTSKYGESIYGTRGGPFSPRKWGAVTQKGNKVYVHVLDWQDEVLAMPVLFQPRSATLLASGAPVSVTVSDRATLLRLPEAGRDPIDTVVVLER